jgi:hypothetical protein
MKPLKRIVSKQGCLRMKRQKPEKNGEADGEVTKRMFFVPNSAESIAKLKGR